MTKKRKIVIWIVSVIVVLGIGGGTAFSFMNRGAEVVGNEFEEMPVTVQKVKEQELVETILVTGQIVPEGEQKVFLEADKGEISEYKVEENQVVKAGDPLYLYDSSKLEVEFTRSVRERDLIQSRGKTELNQIADMNKQIADAKKKLGKPVKKEVSTKEVSTKDDSSIDGADKGVEEIATVDEFQVTQADINQLMNEKVQLEIQYEATKSEIASAQEQINEIDAQRKEMTVVSKIDGVVVKVNQNVAATEAGSTEPVVHIISSKPYKVIGTMSEYDAVKIKKDQPVVIRPKVFKEREWNGKVESVSQFPNEDGGEEAMMMGDGGGGGVTMYPFKVAITDDTSELRQGFHVSLEIKISSGEKPIVVPHSALFDEAGVDIVYVLVDGMLVRREVSTGAMNDEFIAVEDGVKPGELVVLMPDEGMYDGMEVVSFDEVE